MLKKNKKGFYELEEFKKFKGLAHGFSSRKLTDKELLAALDLKKENLVLMEQVHGNRIRVVSSTDGGEMITGVDGLITSTPEVILGVRTADCLPMLFYDSKAKIIGICHAGWRGIVGCLPQKMVDQIIREGGLPGNLLVGIGPHICGQCYSVEKTRSERFLAKFGKLEGMVNTGRKTDFLDLAVPTRAQLIHSGVLEKNIEFGNLCTSCHNEEFFSYRKSGSQANEEMLGVISLSRLAGQL